MNFISGFLWFVFYLSVPILIRYMILRRPLKSKLVTIVVLFILFIFFSSIISIIREYGQIQLLQIFNIPYNTTHHIFGSPLLYLAIFFSYLILRKGYKLKTDNTKQGIIGEESEIKYKCSNCGLISIGRDYREDAERIYCSICNNELDRNKDIVNLTFESQIMDTDSTIKSSPPTIYKSDSAIALKWSMRISVFAIFISISATMMGSNSLINKILLGLILGCFLALILGGITFLIVFLIVKILKKYKDKKSNINCPCQVINSVSKDNLLEEFLLFRDQCPALKEILFPDDFLEDFKNTYINDDSEFDFMSLLAFEGGYLKNITTPIHKFMISNVHKIPKYYLDDLKEFWMIKYQDSSERFKKSRSSFEGRINELIFIDWLDEHDYKIIDLEIWGANIDVIAKNNKGKIYNFEEKYIGDEEWFFDKLNGKNKCLCPSPHYQHDYLLYIAYTAAKKLEKINSNGIISILVKNWNHYDENWIDWNNPSFSKIENKWLKSCPNIEDEICSIFNQISELWLFESDEKFKCHLKQRNIKINNKWKKINY